MRKYNRTSTPNCLRKEYSKGVTVKTDKTNRWESKIAKGQGSKSWTWYNLDAIIKPTLLRISQKHCAFCDKKFSNDEVNNSVEIEHFRSKVKFPKYAFSWTNLFPICRACNKAKGEKYDTNLLKPDTAQYTFNEYFIFNYKTGEIEPNPQKTQSSQNRAKQTIEIYQLNRKGLPEDRLEEFDFYLQNTGDINMFSHRDFIELGT